MIEEYIKPETEIWKVWKDCRRYRKDGICYKGSLWQVSNYGNIKKNGVPYKCRLNCGYKVFSARYSVHRAVAELFIPNLENKPCIDHINGDRLDNRTINLRWCTYKENINNPITLKRKSESRKGTKNPMYGKPKSEESRRKNSEAHKNRHRVYHPDGTYHYEKQL